MPVVGVAQSLQRIVAVLVRHQFPKLAERTTFSRRIIVVQAISETINEQSGFWFLQEHSRFRLYGQFKTSILQRIYYRSESPSGSSKYGDVLGSD